MFINKLHPGILTRLSVFVLTLAALAGCASVGPDYSPPIINVPEQWSVAAQKEHAAEAADLSIWWENLNDPILTGLVEQALKGNNDVRTAMARVRESRASLGISRAGHYPELDATASAKASQNETDTGGQTIKSETQSSSIGLDASWEIDLFGGTRRAIEAAEADLASQEEALRDVQVTLAAEVALTYVKVREYQQQIAITQENLSALREEAAMAKIRKDSGLTSELDLMQAQEALASTEAQLPSLYAGQNESLNSLAILLGMQPGAVHGRLSDPAPVPTPPSGIAAGIPADLLRRRPDIRRAERELAAQTARVGAATSELYPKLSLTGSFVYEELETDSEGLSTSSTSRSTGFGPTLRWPIFRAGAIRRNIDVQDARQEQVLISYEKTVLNALGEVENALRSYREAQRESSLLRQAINAAQEVEQLQNILYQSGLDDFESLLSARKNLLSLQSRLASSEADMVSELIRLYKALGGGWSSDAGEAQGVPDADTGETMRRLDQ
jgi:NodT family efflux transporter outer membrane factor (OMF) lipoprotein